MTLLPTRAQRHTGVAAAIALAVSVFVASLCLSLACLMGFEAAWDVDVSAGSEALIVMATSMGSAITTFIWLRRIVHVAPATEREAALENALSAALLKAEAADERAKRAEAILAHERKQWTAQSRHNAFDTRSSKSPHSVSSLDDAISDPRWAEYDGGLRARMTYVDSDGVITERTVRNWLSEGAYIRGYCEMRRQSRTFRKDRIVDWDAL